MQIAFRLLLGLALATPLLAQRDIGTVNVQGDTSVIPVTVSSSSAELQNLALTAFNAHGRYRLVASGGAYTFNFTPVGSNQVTVSITKGGRASVETDASGRTIRSEGSSGSVLATATSAARRRALRRLVPVTVSVATGETPRPLVMLTVTWFEPAGVKLKV